MDCMSFSCLFNGVLAKIKINIYQQVKITCLCMSRFLGHTKFDCLRKMLNNGINNDSK